MIAVQVRDENTPFTHRSKLWLQAGEFFIRLGLMGYACMCGVISSVDYSFVCKCFVLSLQRVWGVWIRYVVTSRKRRLLRFYGKCAMEQGIPIPTMHELL